MDRQMIEDIVAFCVLMQNGEGITGKAPSYVEEKFKACLNGNKSLDAKNKAIFDAYFKKWY